MVKKALHQSACIQIAAQMNLPSQVYYNRPSCMTATEENSAHHL